MKLTYVISDEVYKYDHPLIEELRKGSLTGEQFVRKLDPSLPFSTNVSERSADSPIVRGTEGPNKSASNL